MKQYKLAESAMPYSAVHSTTAVYSEYNEAVQTGGECNAELQKTLMM